MTAREYAVIAVLDAEGEARRASVRVVIDSEVSVPEGRVENGITVLHRTYTLAEAKAVARGIIDEGIEELKRAKQGVADTNLSDLRSGDL